MGFYFLSPVKTVLSVRFVVSIVAIQTNGVTPHHTRLECFTAEVRFHYKAFTKMAWNNLYLKNA